MKNLTSIINSACKTNAWQKGGLHLWNRDYWTRCGPNLKNGIFWDPCRKGLAMASRFSRQWSQCSIGRKTSSDHLHAHHLQRAPSSFWSFFFFTISLIASKFWKAAREGPLFWGRSGWSQDYPELLGWVQISEILQDSPDLDHVFLHKFRR